MENVPMYPTNGCSEEELGSAKTCMEKPAAVVDADTAWISSKRSRIAFGLAVLVGDEPPDANERVSRSG
jgi:hypothetical protein